MLLKKNAVRSDNTNPVEVNSDIYFVVFFFFLSRDNFFEVNECKLFLLLLVKKCMVSLEIIAVISLSIATVDSFKK